MGHSGGFVGMMSVRLKESRHFHSVRDERHLEGETAVHINVCAQQFHNRHK